MENQKNVCCICGKEFEGYGNNPEPYMVEGVCCNECNQNVVLPARRELSETINRTPVVGDRIRIVNMDGEPHYKGKEGVVKTIDGIGQLHGTWGGCGVLLGVDEIIIID